MGLGPLVMGLVVVEAAYAWGTHTDALEYWLAQRMGRHGLPVQGPALRNLLVRPDAVKVPAWLYPAAVILAVQLTSPTLTQAHCMCVFLPLLPRPSRGVPSRAERLCRLCRLGARENEGWGNGGAEGWWAGWAIRWAGSRAACLAATLSTSLRCAFALFGLSTRPQIPFPWVLRDPIP